MTKIDFIRDSAEFLPLWKRATMEVQSLTDVSSSELLYFDSSAILTPDFFELVKGLLACGGTSDFATLVLKPDPFDYFHFHFGSYPGFVFDANRSYEEYFDFMWQDPGDSPADALGVNSEWYAVFPPKGGWFVFGDRGWNWGTGVLRAPTNVLLSARALYPHFINPPPTQFRIT